MAPYWITWMSVMIIAGLAQYCDYKSKNQMTYAKVIHTKNARILFVLCSAILIVVAGRRYYIGGDFDAYYTGFSYYATDLFRAVREFDEPGIRLVYAIAALFSKNNMAGIFAVALVTLGLELVVIYRNTDRICLAIILFEFMCWTACFNGVRQALAVAVLFCGFSALREKKFWKYAFFVFGAFLCHKSAIVMVLIYFLAHRKMNLRNLLFTTVAVIVVVKSYDYVFQITGWILGADTEEFGLYWEQSVNILRICSKVAPAIFFLLMYKSRLGNEKILFYTNLLVVNAIVAITTANSACLARMSMYTAPFTVIAIVELVKGFNLKSRKLLIPLIVVLYCAMTCYEISKTATLYPFRWV